MPAQNGSRIHSVADAHYITIGQAREMARAESQAAAQAAGDQLARVFEHVLQQELRAVAGGQAQLATAHNALALKMIALEARTLSARWRRFLAWARGSESGVSIVPSIAPELRESHANAVEPRAD